MPTSKPMPTSGHDILINARDFNTKVAAETAIPGEAPLVNSNVGEGWGVNDSREKLPQLYATINLKIMNTFLWTIGVNPGGLGHNPQILVWGTIGG